MATEFGILCCGPLCSWSANLSYLKVLEIRGKHHGDKLSPLQIAMAMITFNSVVGKLVLEFITDHKSANLGLPALLKTLVCLGGDPGLL